MAERTTNDEVMSRSELAVYLSELSQRFEDDENGVDVPVGNKTVSLGRSDDVSVSVDVVERSSKLRGNRETVTVTMSWKPHS
ncbi:amphi-Trp domain-containing protein [Natronococcus sp.]|uniref:amphi-Trp domain-containing protein n=1 Tax=Natronococcus sp. TaxID=35747 RepID=UPI0025DDF475|nr:amphi-Trp domain-containing protein [Natronococcus sp.]